MGRSITIVLLAGLMIGCGEGPPVLSQPDAGPLQPAAEFCGDGLVTGAEACDQGNGNSDDEPGACRSDCTDPRCGDLVVDPGEACDDGEANSDTSPDACRLDCTVASCGDRQLDSGEECDEGPRNSDVRPGACRTTCILPFCGDDVWDSDERCDDGDLNSDTATNACRTDCRPAYCGDDVLDSDEQCDDGAGNSDTVTDACRTDCQRANCGDGVLDSGEACDEGANNSDAQPDICRSTCVLPACGDGTRDRGEACDSGSNNSATIADRCRPECVLPSCGDGTTDRGETCDDAEANSDSEADACRSICQSAGCGDGVVDSGEVCDDGPNNSNVLADACRTFCSPAGCGDGVIDEGEVCDDGPLNSDMVMDACRTQCVLPRCGDGVLDSGEACDDGLMNSDVLADSCRTTCAAPQCGDGVTDQGEQCDNGLLAGNGCDASCLDINECALVGTSTCGVTSACVNTLGGYRCECRPEAFLGAGRCIGYRVPPLVGSLASSRQRWARSGDSNGDGNADLLLFESMATRTTVLGSYLVQNDGSYMAGPPLMTYNLPISNLRNAAVMDINGDGIQDLYVRENGVPPWLNLTGIASSRLPQDISSDWRLRDVGNLDGDVADEALMTPYQQPGLFVLGVAPGPGGLPRSIVTPLLGFTNNVEQAEMVDLNGDGHLDLVVRTTELIIALNTGPPNFAFANLTILLGSQSTTYPFTTGDVDADGDIDVVANGLRDSSVFINSGSGQFLSAAAPRWIGVATHIVDVNGDGRSDILGLGAGNVSGASLMSVQSQQAGGSFLNPVDYYIGRNVPRFVGDTNHDGRADLLLAWSDRLQYGFGYSEGLALPTALQLVPWEDMEALAVIDLDGDGDLDLISYGLPSSSWANARAWSNDGTGRLTNAFRSFGSRPHKIITEDMDGDSLTDVIVLRLNEVSVFRGLATGGISTSPISYSVSAPAGLSDTDGDGDLDVIAWVQGGFQVHRNLSLGSLQPLSSLVGPQGAPPTSGRFDSDGYADVVVGLGASGVAIYRGSASGQLGLPSTYVPVVSTVEEVRLRDLNGDGLDDLVARGTGLFVALSNGTSFGTATLIRQCMEVAGLGADLEVVDLDVDGDLDIAAICGDEIVFALNDGAGGFTIKILPSMESVGMAFGDLDGDGVPDLSVMSWAEGYSSAEYRWLLVAPTLW